MGKRRESDNANVEVARLSAPVSKADTDKAKVLIESKLILDYCAIKRGEKDLAIPALQLGGNI